MIRFFRSMAGRVFLVLALGIVASASLTWWFAFGERQRAIGQFRESRALEQVEQFIATLDAIPAEGRPAFMATSRRFGLRGEAAAQSEPGLSASIKQTDFVQALHERIGKDFEMVSVSTNQSECRPQRMRRRDAEAGAVRGTCETILVTLRDGYQVRLTLLPPRMPLPAPYRPDFLMYLGLFLLSIGVLAFAVARMTVKPLRQLARAAEDLGRNIDHPPLLPQGATEIRQASIAFNAMQEQIRGHLRQNAHILAAITHDLQTPLTRLRLRLEKVADHELRDKLIKDLSHTQAMVREGLDLARSMNSSEPLQLLDLDSLLDTVCADAADTGQDVSLEGKLGMSIMARPNALRRCLTNLIDNAVKYGGYARVSAHRVTVASGTPALLAKSAQAAEWIAVTIRDGGPGIAESELEKVFEPFYRIESSRSRETGGTGLGLSIALNIAKQHNGDIKIANLAGGGMEATLLLPAHPDVES